jgi:hypothetical protein
MIGKPVSEVLRFEDHPTRTQFPPLNVRPMLLDGERVLNVETVKDSFGYAAARVWIVKGR